MSDIDDLTELLRKARQSARDADHANGYRCGFDTDRFMAEYILAAGWMSPSAVRAQPLCRCGHPAEAHEHYRRGSECSAPGCDCQRYQP